MKKIDSKLIKNLASLSAVELKEKEIESIKEYFEKALQLINKVKECEINDEYKHDTVIKLADLREDNEKPGLSQKEVLSCAPKQHRGYFIVPKVVE